MSEVLKNDNDVNKVQSEEIIHWWVIIGLSISRAQLFKANDVVS